VSSQSQVKYRRLIQKAEELFLQYGYKAVSMDQIARGASISKMTIYKHFRTKDDLFAAVLMDLTDTYMVMIDGELKQYKDAIDKIQRLYTFSLEHQSDISQGLIQETLERRVVLEKVSAYKQKGILRIWHTILEEGIKNGDIRPLDIDFTARLLMNLPLAFIDSDYLAGPEALQKTLGHFYDFVKFGLLGQARTDEHHRTKEATPS